MRRPMGVRRSVGAVGGVFNSEGDAARMSNQRERRREDRELVVAMDTTMITLYWRKSASLCASACNYY